MLFDERDLKVFENIELRNYFKEILQLYYSRNYRSAVVMLYSFVVCDLYLKLQSMADNGDKKAGKKIEEIKSMRRRNESYSSVENRIISFFKEECPMHFNNFIEDIEYLTDCRNKCAHLKVNDNSLYCPSDYQTKMLICSMYDNIFSVKSPFIDDLYKYVKSDIENYSQKTDIFDSYFSVKERITEKYLNRMTDNALKISYKSFIRVSFVTENEESQKNISGLYIFVLAISDFIVKNNKLWILSDESVLHKFSQIKTELLKKDSDRLNALLSLVKHCPLLIDVIEKSNSALYQFIRDVILIDKKQIELYEYFYPHTKQSLYSFCKEHRLIKIRLLNEKFLDRLKSSDDFNLAEFFRIAAASVPRSDAFDVSDYFMDFFKGYLSELTNEEINSVMEIYNRNFRCTGRSRHRTDMDEIKEFINSRSE